MTRLSLMVTTALLVSTPAAMAFHEQQSEPLTAPIDRLTPGAIETRDTKEVCVPFNELMRRYPAAGPQHTELAAAVTSAYDRHPDDRNRPHTDPASTIIFRVPLALGGKWDRLNAWPGTMDDWNYYGKLTRWAREQVCVQHTMSLDQAQKLFEPPHDWRTLYKQLGL